MTEQGANVLNLALDLVMDAVLMRDKASVVSNPNDTPPWNVWLWGIMVWRDGRGRRIMWKTVP